MKTKQPTILVVEDDNRIIEILKIRLRAAGYHVSAARDAASAMLMATRLRPDLILLDVVLPGDSGLLVAERLRNTAATAGIPLMFLTASSRPGLQEQAMALGAVGFFEKPYEAGQLLASVDEALERPLGQPPVGQREERHPTAGASGEPPAVPPRVPPTGGPVDGAQGGRWGGIEGVGAWVRGVLAPFRSGSDLPQPCQRRPSRKIPGHP
jgi:CheY-like chemotaxis protein